MLLSIASLLSERLSLLLGSEPRRDRPERGARRAEGSGKRHGGLPERPGRLVSEQCVSDGLVSVAQALGLTLVPEEGQVLILECAGRSLFIP